MKKSILITGGLGFIGINLTKKLLKNTSYSIRILTRKKNSTFLKNLPFELNSNRLEIVYGNILGKKTVKKIVHGSTAIVHLASNTHTEDGQTQPETLIRTNVIGTTMLLETAKNQGVEKIILLSSSGVYANNDSKTPFDEKHQLRPFNLYSASKLAVEEFANVYYKSYKLPIVILRPFNVYGPYQARTKPIPLFISKLLQNKKISLNYGGKQIRDWLYIDDIVAAIEKILQTRNKKILGEVFNVATGRGMSIKDVATRILLELNKDRTLLQFVKGTYPEPMYNVGDSTKIQNMLRWKPQCLIEDGIRRTIEWYKHSI